jgi:hypothetical protein
MQESSIQTRSKSMRTDGMCKATSLAGINNSHRFGEICKLAVSHEFCGMDDAWGGVVV